MRVTSLVENEIADGRTGLASEHGLSLLIETTDCRVLFDMGVTGAFADNAEAMGIDLASVDVAIVSHHHFDHGGGLERFLEVNDRAVVHLRAAPPVHRHLRILGPIKKDIGIDTGIFDRRPDRFRFHSENAEIAPGLWILTEIPVTHERPRGNRWLMVDDGSGPKEDPFDHELVLIARERDASVVFSACSHNGILNMVEAARGQFPSDPITAVFGGFHLVDHPMLGGMASPRHEVERMAETLLEWVDGTVYTGHCTGKKAFSVLSGVMGDRLKLFSTGASAEV